MSLGEVPLFALLILSLVAVSMYFGWELRKRRPCRLDRDRIADLVGAMRGTGPDYGWGDWLIACYEKEEA